MGDFRALPRRLCRRPKLKYPFDDPTADIRISLCCIMDSGDWIASLKNRAHTECSCSAYFTAASGRYNGVSSTVRPL